jgi:tetratricopeptide (TPR) repeat protein
VVEAARKAFSDGQFGRAAELFGRAVEMTPNEPSAYWLLSQAYFALGKYHEAVQAIATGMALRADWSESRFVSRDLYWKHPEQFDEHLKTLRDAVGACPDDAGLLFLLGHELWFDGKHDEAKVLIQKAKAIGKGATPADVFLK